MLATTWVMSLASRAVDEYLTHVIQLVEVHYRDLVHSIIIFGSLATRKDFTKFSDSDLLIVLKEGVPRTSPRARRLEQQVLHLERHYLSHLEDNKPFLLRAIEFQTGMFRNFFITTLEEIKKGRFERIFHTNAILTKLLAPRAITLHSVFQKARVVWGEDVRPLVKRPAFHPSEILKSMVMNLLTIAGVYVLSIAYFRRTPTLMRYVMNSVKWSLHACYTYLTGKAATIEEESAFFLKKVSLDAPSRQALQLFLQLRGTGAINGMFLLLAPYLTWKLHVLTLSIKIN